MHHPLHIFAALVVAFILACEPTGSGGRLVPETPITLDTSGLAVDLGEATLAYRVAREELTRVRPDWKGDPPWDVQITDEPLLENDGTQVAGITYDRADWSRVQWEPRLCDTAFQHELFHVWCGHWTSTYDQTHDHFPEIWKDAEPTAKHRLRTLVDAMVLEGSIDPTLPAVQNAAR